MNRPRGLAVATALVLLALLSALLLSSGGQELVEVPDVRGIESGTAAAQLRMAGFKTDVSFRPVTEGQPDLVIETIPPNGQEVKPGSEIHIIASALARTPEPVVEEDREEERGKSRGKERDEEKD